MSSSSSAAAATDPLARHRIWLDLARLRLDRERLRFDRQRAYLKFRLRRREQDRKQPWALAFVSNPFSLAVVGGFITLMTQIITTQFNEAARRNEGVRQAQAEEAAQKLNLQTDLIKKFAEAPDLITARGNMEFLLNAGLLPDYADRIRAYLITNPWAPRVSAFGGTEYRYGCGGIPVAVTVPTSLDVSIVTDDTGKSCEITIGDASGEKLACSHFDASIALPKDAHAVISDFKEYCIVIVGMNDSK